jgi:hypothetical protein
MLIEIIKNLDVLVRESSIAFINFPHAIRLFYSMGLY